MNNEQPYHNLPFLAGGGDMGELIRSKDWQSTTLGAPHNWPPLLKQLIAQMLVNSFPMLVCWGSDFIQFYNDAFRPINGESKHPQALGGTAKNTYSEIWGTIGPMFAKVIQGEPIGFPNFMVSLDRNGYVEDCYFDFSYSPIKDENGDIHGVLVICQEVTSQVNARKVLQTNNEQIAAANEEMTAANDELTANNENLSEAQQQLGRLYQELEISEKRYRNEKLRLERFFMQAPAGICILDGPDYKFELINPFYELLFPDRELLGRSLLTALPELKGGPVIDILDHVYQTGESFEGKSLLIPVTNIDQDILEDRYFDFIYQPRINEQDQIDGILVFVIEVTESFVKESRIREQQKTTEHLYEQVKLLNDKKDEFIGLASHELKTPLTSINGYLQIISRMHNDPNSKRFIDRSLQQLGKLTALVNDLLDVSKIEAGKLRFNMAEFDLRPLAEDVIELMQHSTNKYIFSFDTPVASCLIMGDSQRIEQVLMNLLTNAIKYSPNADKVEISLQCSSNKATISIRDFGMGIAAEKLGQVFDRFYRVDDAAPNISGLGIGLYLSHEIIARHQGRLWAESEPGNGSTFYFELPTNGSV